MLTLKAHFLTVVSYRAKNDYNFFRKNSMKVCLDILEE